MKTMLISDLLIARNTLLQLLGICVVVGLVMCYTMETVVGGVAAVAAMAPFMYLFTMAALDEQNGWERFRLTLPLSRRQVIFGRYASLLAVSVGMVLVAFLVGVAVSAVASALSDGQPDSRLTLLSFAFNPPEALFASVAMAALVVLLGASVGLPLIARFGMTKATRFVPLAFVIAIAAIVGFFGGEVTSIGFLTDLEAAIDTGNWSVLVGGFIAITIAVLVLYVASAFLAAKLYERREF